MDWTFVFTPDEGRDETPLATGLFSGNGAPAEVNGPL